MSIAQSQATVVPAHVAADVTAFSRALVVATRARQMYAAEHPAAMAAVDRCRATIGRLAAFDGLVLGVTPTTMLVNGEPLPSAARVQEASALLNDKDILGLQVIATPEVPELCNFLSLLGRDSETIRHHGGPAIIWEGYGHYWLRLEQIDYESLLAPAEDSGDTRPDEDAAAPSKDQRLVARDAVWQSLVRTMADGRRQVEASGEQRLLEITRSAEAIHALTAEAVATQDGPDATAREAARAATVLLAFQRLVSFVEQQSPGELPATLDNIAEAASRMDPALLMRAVSEAAESGVGTDIVKAIGARFNDDQIAELLAAVLAAEGKATARMAAALTTITSDDSRRGRVLRLARSRVPETLMRTEDQVSLAWLVLEKFLAGPEDAAYVSHMYGESIEQAEERSYRLRLDAPRKLEAWLRTVSAESVRTLSSTVMLDLFALEDRPNALLETAQDLAVLSDDLLLAGDIVEASRVVAALRAAADSGDPDRSASARSGLDDALRLPALAETASCLGDLEPEALEAFDRMCRALGPGVLDLLIHALCHTDDDATRARLGHTIVTFEGEAAVRIARAVRESESDDSRVLIRLMRQLGAHAVAALESIIERGSPDQVRAAVGELASLDDPAAERILSAMLRAESRSVRLLAVDALAATRGPRASVLLAGALADADPLGSDHEVALRLLAALRLVGDREAVPAVVDAMRKRRFFARRRAARVARLAISVLIAMRTDDARQALEQALTGGDRLLRRSARAAGQGLRG